MMTSAVCTPSWIPATGETSFTEVPRLPATGGARSGRLAGPAAGRSSIEALGPGAMAPWPENHYRGPAPCGALGAPGPGPRDVVLVVSCIQSSARRVGPTG